MLGVTRHRTGLDCEDHRSLSEVQNGSDGATRHPRGKASVPKPKSMPLCVMLSCFFRCNSLPAKPPSWDAFGGDRTVEFSESSLGGAIGVEMGLHME